MGCVKRGRVFAKGKCLRECEKAGVDVYLKGKCVNKKLKEGKKTLAKEEKKKLRLKKFCFRRGRVYSDFKCLKRCIKGTNYIVIKGFCIKKKVNKAKKIVNKTKHGCAIRGRIYKHPRCTKTC